MVFVMDGIRAVGSLLEVNQQGRSVQRPLRERLIDGQIVLGKDVGIVHVGQDADDPACIRADAGYLNASGSVHIMCRLIGSWSGEQLLRDALAGQRRPFRLPSDRPL